MSINFSFNSFDNSKQNNNIVVNNNEIDKILKSLKEINLSEEDIAKLKNAINEDKTNNKQTNTLGNNVKKWCTSIFDKIVTGAIVDITLPIAKEKLANVLYAIYQFPIQF